MDPDPILVLIDGECALCNGTARWFSARDRRGAMVFAPNTGETARILGEAPGGDQRTIVVWQGSRRLVRSRAVGAMLRRLGGGWGFLGRLVTFFPAGLADPAYDLVAGRRHRFGRVSACALLNPWHLAD